MINTLESWYFDGTQLVRRGRTPSGPDNFVLGTTMPTAANTGVFPDIARTVYSGPTTITGSTDPANPTLIQNVNIASLITINSGYVNFYNCLFTGGPGTYSVGQLTTRAAGVQRVNVTRCTFCPTSPSYYLDGVMGHHYTVLRCDISRVVDGFGSYNQYGARTDNYILGNYIHDQVRYEVDDVHTDGTHNDGVQHQGGQGLWIQGNAFHGYQFHEDWSVPPDPWQRVAQGVLTQENVAVGGVYYSGDFHITNNWTWGLQQVYRPATRASSLTTYDIEITNNTQMDMPRDWLGSTHYYTIRATSNVTVNGIAYPTTGVTTDTFGNHFDTGTGVDLAYRGTPFMVHCDLGG